MHFDFLQSIQLLSHVWFFVTPWTSACQASLSITNSRSLLKFMSIESMMQSNHLILCPPLLLPHSIFPSMFFASGGQNISFSFNKVFSSVQLFCRVRLFATPWIIARQASLSITNSRSSLRFTSIESVMPSSHLLVELKSELKVVFGSICFCFCIWIPFLFAF